MEGFFFSKYWKHSPCHGVRELDGEEGTKNRFSPWPGPWVGERGHLESLFQPPLQGLKACEVKERNQCMRHRHCSYHMKCYLFSCGKRYVCSMPKETGPCFAYLPRWWYDKETELCSRFIYGGCQRNPNNFPSEAICLVICKKRWQNSFCQVSRGCGGEGGSGVGGKGDGGGRGEK
uniref:BPTI/Kunitz inhibitor domain-containing protein n=1 Tax=Castor canadensis TaxID=51338 RepID=A0A8C0XBV0_CASCN